jgi:hypothetical protein
MGFESRNTKNEFHLKGVKIPTWVSNCTFLTISFQESHIDVFHANIFRSGQELDFGETNLDPKSNDFFFSNEFIYQDLDSYKVGGSNSQMTNPVPSKVRNNPKFIQDLHG